MTFVFRFEKKNSRLRRAFLREIRLFPERSWDFHGQATFVLRFEKKIRACGALSWKKIGAFPKAAGIPTVKNIKLSDVEKKIAPARIAFFAIKASTFLQVPRTFLLVQKKKNGPCSRKLLEFPLQCESAPEKDRASFRSQRSPSSVLIRFFGGAAGKRTRPVPGGCRFGNILLTFFNKKKCLEKSSLEGQRLIFLFFGENRPWKKRSGKSRYIKPDAR